MKRNWQKNTVIGCRELQYVLQMRSSGLGTTFSCNVQAANEQLHLFEIHLCTFWKELNIGNSTQTSRGGLDFCQYLSYIRLDLKESRTREEVKYICCLSFYHVPNTNGPVHVSAHEQCSPQYYAGLSFRMPCKQTKVQKFLVPPSL